MPVAFLNLIEGYFQYDLRLNIKDAPALLNGELVSHVQPIA